MCVLGDREGLIRMQEDLKSKCEMKKYSYRKPGKSTFALPLKWLLMMIILPINLNIYQKDFL